MIQISCIIAMRLLHALREDEMIIPLFPSPVCLKLSLWSLDLFTIVSPPLCFSLSFFQTWLTAWLWMTSLSTSNCWHLGWPQIQKKANRQQVLPGPYGARPELSQGPPSSSSSSSLYLDLINIPAEFTAPLLLPLSPSEFFTQFQISQCHKWATSVFQCSLRTVCKLPHDFYEFTGMTWALEDYLLF